MQPGGFTERTGFEAEKQYRAMLATRDANGDDVASDAAVVFDDATELTTTPVSRGRTPKQGHSKHGKSQRGRRAKSTAATTRPRRSKKTKSGTKAAHRSKSRRRRQQQQQVQDEEEENSEDASMTEELSTPKSSHHRRRRHHKRASESVSDAGASLATSAITNGNGAQVSVVRGGVGSTLSSFDSADDSDSSSAASGTPPPNHTHTFAAWQLQ